MKRWLTLVAFVMIFGLCWPLEISAETNSGTVSVKINGSLEPDNFDSIQLESVPSIEFGAISMGSVGTAKTIDGNVKVFNPGLASGWTVQVAMSEFEADNGKHLNGAQLIFSSGLVTPSDGEEGGEENLPVAKNQTLSADNPVSIFVAQAGTGIGEWQLDFAPSNISLKTPLTNQLGVYESKLSWQLIDAPDK